MNTHPTTTRRAGAARLAALAAAALAAALSLTGCQPHPSAPCVAPTARAHQVDARPPANRRACPTTPASRRSGHHGRTTGAGKPKPATAPANHDQRRERS